MLNDIYMILNKAGFVEECINLPNIIMIKLHTMYKKASEWSFFYDETIL